VTLPEFTARDGVMSLGCLGDIGDGNGGSPTAVDLLSNNGIVDVRVTYDSARGTRGGLLESAPGTGCSSVANTCFDTVNGDVT